ncbi:MAG: HD domain-containing protein [Nitrososphaerota archaeon]|nr:HD domain-containing protein [Nitrososphaerota archaeon]
MKKAKIKDAESVADHSFRMALIGAYVSEMLGLDSSKVMRMCLIHDLAESMIGDLMPEEKTSENSHRKLEDMAMRKILGKLPAKVSKRFVRDWAELYSGRSKEAKAVWEIDRLEMGLQMKDYALRADPGLLRTFDPSSKLSGYFLKVLKEYSPST